jgi:hypothetical protein
MGDAAACRGPQFEQRALFRDLDDAPDRPEETVVVRVDIGPRMSPLVEGVKKPGTSEVVQRPVPPEHESKSLATVREVFRGQLSPGDTVVVVKTLTSCSAPFIVGSSGIVVGSIIDVICPRGSSCKVPPASVIRLVTESDAERARRGEPRGETQSR